MDQELACETAVNDRVPTLMRVMWAAPEGASSWVEYRTQDGQLRETAVSQDSAQSHTLFGAFGGETVQWTGVSETADGDQLTCAGETEVGWLDISDLNIETDGGWDPAIPYLLGVYYELLGTTVHVWIMDREGRFVWAIAGDSGVIGMDAHVTTDGLYYNQFARDYSVDASEIIEVSWTGVERSRTSAPGHHHSFDVTDTGLVYQIIDPREVVNPDTGKTETWVGDGLVETQPGGVGTQVFSVWDWLPIATNAEMSGLSFYGGIDWTHGNFVNWDSTTDRYLLSLAHPATVVEIDRTTGAPTRLFGRDGYSFAEGSEPFAYQHNPVWLDDGSLMVFSTPEASETNSGAIRYAVDDATQTLTETWSYTADGRSICLGQALPLPSGNVLVNRGCAFAMEEVTAEGDVVWSTGTPGGTAFGQVKPLSELPWEAAAKDAE